VHFTADAELFELIERAVTSPVSACRNAICRVLMKLVLSQFVSANGSDVSPSVGTVASRRAK